MQSMIEDELEQARFEGGVEMLERVRASLKAYPNAGGDIEVMTAVEVIIRRCAGIVLDTDVVRVGGHHSREDDGNATLLAASEAILKEFGLQPSQGCIRPSGCGS